jgi:class IIb bacteriocin, lactobin A/cerein 7B family
MAPVTNEELAAVEGGLGPLGVFLLVKAGAVVVAAVGAGIAYVATKVAS